MRPSAAGLVGPTSPLLCTPLPTRQRTLPGASTLVRGGARPVRPWLPPARRPRRASGRVGEGCGQSGHVCAPRRVWGCGPPPTRPWRRPTRRPVRPAAATRRPVQVTPHGVRGELGATPRSSATATAAARADILAVAVTTGTCTAADGLVVAAVTAPGRRSTPAAAAREQQCLPQMVRPEARHGRGRPKKDS